MPLLNVTEDSVSSASPTPDSSPSLSSFLPQTNCSVSPSPSSPPYNFYAVLLVLLIFCVVFGNVLVCVAVSREKALQTTTNYLIVSLAVSDLLLATLVMPWGVYLEVVGEWRFSRIHCDILLTLDVMMCTASILNLCAISIDRYTAVAMPLLYNTRYSSRRRVALMIAVVWFLSFAISCPLLFGLNNTASQEGRDCSFADPAFVVYSSVASFYVPFIVTLLVYVQICVVLRRRGRRTAPSRRHGLHPEPRDAQRSRKNKCTHPEDVKLCTLIVKPPPAAPQRKKVTLVKEAVVHPLDVEPVCFLNPDRDQQQQSVSVAPSPALSGPGPRRATAQENTHTQKGAAAKERARGRLSQQKERKATQMLAIVLVACIFFCKKICLRLHHVDNFMFKNLNPVIYTTFNIEFRKAFIKILHC
uniref:D(2)-like dopamine receptor n=1 Tax=Sinocyclocheilus rhinocerous TaxID=307959 RepID=A0A673KVM1_9TELE